MCVNICIKCYMKAQNIAYIKRVVDFFIFIKLLRVISAIIHENQ